MSDSVDVVVVGAGLSGLSAATTLVQAGRRVRVLESDDEVGGRTRSRWDLGPRVEFGGEWIGPAHRNMLRLAAELDVRVRPARQLGHPVLWRGRQRTSVGRLPALGPRARLTLLRACLRLDRLGRTVDPVRPWLSPDADVLDAQDVGTWLRARGVRGDGLHYLATVLEALTSTRIDRLSLLHLLWWIARGNGLVRILRTTFAYHLVEGAQSLSTRLAARVGDVRLGCPVHRVVAGQRAEGAGREAVVEVATADGATVRAREVVVTAPIGSLSRIEFAPALPAPLAELDELRGEPGTKVSALLPSGHRVRHRVAIGGDTVRVAWRVGPRVTGFVPHDDLAPDGVLVDELARMFGAHSAELRQHAVYRWREHPGIPACDIGFAPGQLRRHGPWLTTPHGRVHFAGAERSSWPNNMEGAVESGIHAARAVLTG